MERWQRDPAVIVTRAYLRANPNYIFVFGDNDLRKGLGGAAVLRNEPNTYGFITKKAPNNDDESFYRPAEYHEVYKREIYLLQRVIEKNPEKTFLISQLGGGLANRYWIWEEVIEPRLEEDLQQYKNIRLLWKEKGVLDK